MQESAGSVRLSTDRGQGLLVGLALGDRNGGPVQMALALAEDLAHKKVISICGLCVNSDLTSRPIRNARDCMDPQVYSPVSVFRRYCSWWDGGKGIDAWDTGPVAKSALEWFQKSAYSKTIGKNDTVLAAMEQNSKEFDRIKNGYTAGANAAHRSSTLAGRIRISTTDRTNMVWCVDEDTNASTLPAYIRLSQPLWPCAHSSTSTL